MNPEDLIACVAGMTGGQRERLAGLLMPAIPDSKLPLADQVDWIRDRIRLDPYGPLACAVRLVARAADALAASQPPGVSDPDAVILPGGQLPFVAAEPDVFSPLGAFDGEPIPGQLTRKAVAEAIAAHCRHDNATITSDHGDAAGAWGPVSGAGPDQPYVALSRRDDEIDAALQKEAPCVAQEKGAPSAFYDVTFAPPSVQRQLAKGLLSEALIALGRGPRPESAHAVTIAGITLTLGEWHDYYHRRFKHKMELVDVPGGCALLPLDYEVRNRVLRAGFGEADYKFDLQVTSRPHPDRSVVRITHAAFRAVQENLDQWAGTLTRLLGRTGELLRTRGNLRDLLMETSDGPAQVTVGDDECSFEPVRSTDWKIATRTEVRISPVVALAIQANLNRRGDEPPRLLGRTGRLLGSHDGFHDVLMMLSSGPMEITVGEDECSFEVEHHTRNEHSVPKVRISEDVSRAFQERLNRLDAKPQLLSRAGTLLRSRGDRHDVLMMVSDGVVEITVTTSECSFEEADDTRDDPTIVLKPRNKLLKAGLGQEIYFDAEVSPVPPPGSPTVQIIDAAFQTLQWNLDRYYDTPPRLLSRAGPLLRKRGDLYDILLQTSDGPAQVTVTSHECRLEDMHDDPAPVAAPVKPAGLKVRLTEAAFLRIQDVWEHQKDLDGLAAGPAPRSPEGVIGPEGIVGGRREGGTIVLLPTADPAHPHPAYVGADEYEFV